MSLLILTGPTGAGKNQTAFALAKLVDNCAVIDFDSVRAMFANPHKAPDDGEDGLWQQEFGVQNVCMMASNFVESGWQVIILDVLSEESAELYRELLEQYSPRIVMLLPTFEEIRRRNEERAKKEGGLRLTPIQIVDVYEQQAEFTGFDLRIDNTNVQVDQLAASLLGELQE